MYSFVFLIRENDIEKNPVFIINYSCLSFVDTILLISPLRLTNEYFFFMQELYSFDIEKLTYLCRNGRWTYNQGYSRFCYHTIPWHGHTILIYIHHKTYNSFSQIDRRDKLKLWVHNFYIKYFFISWDYSKMYYINVHSNHSYIAWLLFCFYIYCFIIENKYIYNKQNNRMTSNVKKNI